MMRFLAVLLVLLSSLFVFAQNPAFAGPKPWSWGWWPGHWRNLARVLAQRVVVTNKLLAE